MNTTNDGLNVSELFDDMLRHTVRTWDPDRTADPNTGDALAAFLERLDDLYDTALKLRSDKAAALQIVRKGAGEMISVAAAARDAAAARRDQAS